MMRAIFAIFILTSLGACSGLQVNNYNFAADQAAHNNYLESQYAVETEYVADCYAYDELKCDFE